MARQAANVRVIQTLDDLSGALARFAGETSQAMTATEREVGRTLEWLQERLHHWQREVERWHQEVQRARAALVRCQNSGYCDRDGSYHAPDCSAYEAALAMAHRRLREAEMELANVRRWMGRVQQTVQEYRRHSRRLQQLTTTQTKQAQAVLGRKLADLVRYQAVTIPSAPHASSGGALEKSSTDVEGSVNYGELDALGCPRGIQARITPEMIDTGTSASSSIFPPGFGGEQAGHARAHLLAKQLGGSGNDLRNLVTLLQNPVNSPVMRGFENQVRVAVEAGEIVSYKVKPIYETVDRIPAGITIQATGDKGFKLFVSIPNRKW